MSARGRDLRRRVDRKLRRSLPRPLYHFGRSRYYDVRALAQKDLGGHAVLVTGYVDNTKLPAGIAAGSGGGYLIIKNSWGTGSGDGGYFYVPYDYIKTYATGLTVILDVAM